MRLPAISTEACIGILLGLVAWVVELTWEIRGLFSLVAAGLAVHIARRLEYNALIRAAIASITICILVAGTYRPIWTGFHDDFPEIGSEADLFRIIQFSVVAACAIAGYIFLVRPRGKEGYQVLPAQLIAFGAVVVAVGFVPIAIGLAWQFRQNWINGVSPTGAPVAVAAGPQRLQIAHTQSPPALPPPIQKDNPLVQGYNLTEAGVRALTDDLYKHKDSFKRIDVERLSTDPSPTGLLTSLSQACDRAGVDCSFGTGHLNSPDDRGIMIYVNDPKNPPEPAKRLQEVLERLGFHSPFVFHPSMAPDGFVLFLGPAP